jgi:hypothetical protein
VGFDTGPLQLATNVWGKSPYTDNLQNPFGTFATDMATRKYQGFNGSVADNLALGVQAFKYILSISKSNADAAGLYRAGSRTGPGYSDRSSQYQSEWQANKAYLDCLDGKK